MIVKDATWRQCVYTNVQAGVIRRQVARQPKHAGLAHRVVGRLEARGYNPEWKDVIRDLDRLQEIEIEQDQKRFVLRTEATGACGKVFQATGVAMPPTVRQVA